jgi:hypothetical protein
MIVDEVTDAIPNSITEEEFIVEYNGFRITPNTTLNELVEALSYGNEEEHESNNNGYINTIDYMQIFGLRYPDYNNTVIRVIYHKNLIDGSDYISAIQLYDGCKRGLKVGDSRQKVIDVYGRPDEKIASGSLVNYISYLDGKYLEISMKENETKVFYIMINYKSLLSD